MGGGGRGKQPRIKIKCELPVGKITNHPGRGGGVNREERLIRGRGGRLFERGLNGGFTEVMKKISNKFH